MERDRKIQKIVKTVARLKSETSYLDDKSTSFWEKKLRPRKIEVGH